MMSNAPTRSRPPSLPAPPQRGDLAALPAELRGPCTAWRRSVRSRGAPPALPHRRRLRAPPAAPPPPAARASVPTVPPGPRAAPVAAVETQLLLPPPPRPTCCCRRPTRGCPRGRRARAGGAGGDPGIGRGPAAGRAAGALRRNVRARTRARLGTRFASRGGPGGAASPQAALSRPQRAAPPRGRRTAARAPALGCAPAHNCDEPASGFISSLTGPPWAFADAGNDVRDAGLALLVSTLVELDAPLQVGPSPRFRPGAARL